MNRYFSRWPFYQIDRFGIENILGRNGHRSPPSASLSPEQACRGSVWKNIYPKTLFLKLTFEIFSIRRRFTGPNHNRGLSFPSAQLNHTFVFRRKIVKLLSIAPRNMDIRRSSVFFWTTNVMQRLETSGGKLPSIWPHNTGGKSLKIAKKNYESKVSNWSPVRTSEIHQNLENLHEIIQNNHLLFVEIE